MAHTDPYRIVIVGGGTAGWMAAAALSWFNEIGYQIELIESEDIGTVGVGEATIPGIIQFNQALKIDEDDFLRATQGTFKLGIEFVDWGKRGQRYMHAFGTVGRDLGLVTFHQYWLKARQLGIAKDLAAYALNNMAGLAGRMQRVTPAPGSHVPAMPYAFHFDAGLYAAYLRRGAEARHVKRTEGKVVDVRLHSDNGHVDSVLLENGTVVHGDFFIDCSGFRGLLIEEALHTGYEDWSHWLPCDRALAVPCASAKPPTPYTRATARSAGWQWRIPLQHRIGNGHVYCSHYISEDEACGQLLANLDGEALADPRPLKFVTGKRKKMWHRNVVAMGLAGGFMEPLESTSIHLIQSAITRLLKLCPGHGFAEADADEFNRQSDLEYERIRDFIILHYKATERDDTPFWRMCRDMPVPETLKRKINLFRGNGHLFHEAGDLFTEVAWLQVMIGQGIMPSGFHPLANQLDTADLAEFLTLVETVISREVGKMPSHADFIAGHCAATPVGRLAA